MKNFSNKRLWGVLGKQKTYVSPSDILKDKEKQPLNKNPLNAWDYKKSDYRRVDLVPRDMTYWGAQQGGTVEGQQPQPSPPQPSPSPTPTPSPVPLLWNTFNINWENANINWENA